MICPAAQGFFFSLPGTSKPKQVPHTMAHELTMAAAVVCIAVAIIVFAAVDGAQKAWGVIPLFLGCVAAVRYYLEREYLHLKEENAYLDYGGALETL